MRNPPASLQLSDVAQLAKLLEKHGLAEVHFSDGKSQITLKKDSRAVSPAPALPMPGLAALSHASAASVPAVEKSPSSEKSGAKVKEITSPMVGTFYASPSPGAEPFVQAGSQVKAGQVLCVIEAMKIMNEIESDVAGTVEEACVPSETPVEYGTVLFRVRVA